MKQGTPELSRRQLLAAAPISSLPGIAKGSVANESNWQLSPVTTGRAGISNSMHKSAGMVNRA
jgi:hypothetical protein